MIVERYWGLQLGIGEGGASIDASAGAPLSWVPTGVPGGFLDGAETVPKWKMVVLVHNV